MAEILSQEEINRLLNNVKKDTPEKKSDKSVTEDIPVFPKPGGSLEDLKKSDESIHAAPISGRKSGDEKKLEVSFSPELKKVMGDLNVGEKIQDAVKVPAMSEKKDEFAHNNEELLRVQEEIKILGKKMADNPSNLTQEEKDDIVGKYIDLQKKEKLLRTYGLGSGLNSVKTSDVLSVEEQKNVKQEPEVKKKIVFSPIPKTAGTVEVSPETKKDGVIEKKEYSDSQLLDAAEIFCKYNPFGYATDIEKNAAGAKAIELVKKDHSSEEIAAAVHVAEVRNNMRGLVEKAKSVEEQYKNAKENQNADISQATAKRDQQIESIRRDKKLLENEYGDLLRNLKIENIKHQLAGIEKFKEHGDFPEKVENVEKTAFAMINSEMMRWQDARIDTNRKINPKGWDHVVNFFSRAGEKAGKSKMLGRYFKMNRSLRTALTAAVIGAGTAVILPSAVIAAGVGTAGYLGVKAINAMTGGAYSYQISKRIIQPLEGKAYGSDTKKTTEKFQGEVLRDEHVKRLEDIARGGMDQNEVDALLAKISDKNIKVSEKYAQEMRRHGNYRKANRFLGTLAAGLLGGQGAVMTTDYLLGPGMLNIFGAKDVNAAEVLPDDKTGEVMPVPEAPEITSPEINPETLKMGTVGEGEGVEHVFRRQLEADPGKFGFKGDLTDKAAIRAWSGGEAHRIAIDEGYVDAVTGKEVRVFDMGPDGPEGNPAYILEQGADGKPNVREYFEGKMSGGEGTKNVYEYLHDKPKVIADTPAVEEAPAKSGSDLYAERLKAPVEAMGLHTPEVSIPDHLELPPSVQRANIFDNFNKVVPEMEHMIDQFPKLSLSQQEEFLYGAKMNTVAEQVTYLQKNNVLENISESEAEVFGKLKDHWLEMSEVFEENEKNFEAAVKGTVQLNNAGFEKLMNTKIHKIWDIPNGPQFNKFSDLLKSVNVSSNELASGASVGEILRTRFVNGEFMKAAQVDSVLKI